MHTDMSIDRKSLSSRAWAVPAISALLMLHQDFDPPRHVSLSRLTWYEDSCEIALQYGMQNLSGKLMKAIDLRIVIRRDEAVTVEPIGVCTPRELYIAQFLAGEVFRQAFLWREDFEAWNEGGADWEKAAIFSIVSALAGIDAQAMEIRVERDGMQQNSVRRLHIDCPLLSCEISPFGRYGVNLLAKGKDALPGKTPVSQFKDVRPEERLLSTPSFSRKARTASAQLLRLLLLPLDMLLHLLEHLQYVERVQIATIASTPSTSIRTSGFDDLPLLRT